MNSGDSSWQDLSSSRFTDFSSAKTQLYDAGSNSLTNYGNLLNHLFF